MERDSGFRALHHRALGNPVLGPPGVERLGRGPAASLGNPTTGATRLRS